MLLILREIKLPEKLKVRLRIKHDSEIENIKISEPLVISELFVKEGQLVRKGQPLARFESFKFYSELSQSLNELRSLDKFRFSSNIEAENVVDIDSEKKRKKNRLLEHQRSLQNSKERDLQKDLNCKLEGCRCIRYRKRISDKLELFLKIDSLNDSKRDVILIASTNGIVNFSKSIQIGKSFLKNDSIFYIIPNSKICRGEITLSNNMLANTRKGESILIKIVYDGMKKGSLVRCKVLSICPSSIDRQISICIVEFSYDFNMKLNRSNINKQIAWLDAELSLRGVSVFDKIVDKIVYPLR
jgi:hypothetical protein